MSPEEDRPSEEAEAEATGATPEEVADDAGAEVLAEAMRGDDGSEEGESGKSKVTSAMLAQLQQFGPAPHPLADVINSDHIESMIEVQSKHTDNVLEDRKDHRYHAKFIYVATGVFILALIGVLAWTGNSAQVQPIIRALVLVGAAAFGGWGFAQRQR